MSGCPMLLARGGSGYVHPVDMSVRPVLLARDGPGYVPPVWKTIFALPLFPSSLIISDILPAQKGAD